MKVTEYRCQFKEWPCIVKKENYANNGRTALELIHAEDGESVAIATINMPDLPIPDDLVVIKDYSENEGMLQALIDAKIVSTPLEYIETGFVTVPVCRLLI